MEYTETKKPDSTPERKPDANAEYGNEYGETHLDQNPEENQSSENIADEQITEVYEPEQIQQSARVVKDAHHRRIESVMETDLLDIYTSMEGTRRKAFKVQGEALAQRVREDMEKGAFNAVTVFQGMDTWLKTARVPNMAYRIQEAGKKTRKLRDYIEAQNTMR